ncbi:MAG: hypothetical protein HYV09_22310 [Deltaproteobacteria bacterium]|nr:hypothetical protein [Deltaproteobacteria bacterium]
MNRTTTWLGALVLALSISTSPACSKSAPSKPEPLKTLVVSKVSADLSKPDPDAAYWKDTPEGLVKMLAQPMIAPRPETTTTETIVVQAVHDGERAAFRLRWKDADKSEAGRLGEYSDGLALEFPVKDGPTPPVMMGGQGMPVHLFHWRAQYQRDEEQGKPTVKQLYPNQSVDMYPHEYKEAPGNPSAAEAFLPAVIEGNPQAYQKVSVDEILAEGYSTSSVVVGHGATAKGAWANGEWTLVIVRPLAIPGYSSLKLGAEGNVAFAVWQGGKGEVGSRKCVTMQWTPVRIQ